jgi:bifunctional non-homologous end joining protein LigD
LEAYVPKNPPPTFVPIRLKPREMPFDDPNWSFEIKYDGFRGLLFLMGDRSYFMSRDQKRLPRFDELARAIAKEISISSAVLDGEIAVLDKEGRPIFADLMKQVKKPAYIAFDLLYADHKDLRMRPLTERRERLARLMPEDPVRILQAGFVEGCGKKFFELIVTRDLEGVVAKRLDQPYRATTPWYKIKNTEYSQNAGREKFFTKKRSTRRR